MCQHYCGRGVMRKFASGAEIAKDMGIPPAKLQAAFEKYNKGADAKNVCCLGFDVIFTHASHHIVI